MSVATVRAPASPAPWVQGEASEGAGEAPSDIDMGDGASKVVELARGTR